MFWLVLELEISYNRVIFNFLKDFGIYFRGFFEDYIFA